MDVKVRTAFYSIRVVFSGSILGILQAQKPGLQNDKFMTSSVTLGIFSFEASV